VVWLLRKKIQDVTKMLGHFKNAWANFESDFFHIKKEKECDSACTNVSGNECSRVRRTAKGEYLFRLSVRLSVRMEYLGSPWTDFREI
jgi:hypothetical protein